MLTPQQRQAVAADNRTQREIAADYGISQAAVSKIKAADIPQPNSYEIGDAIAFLRRLKRHRVPVTVVAMSPPYNTNQRPRRSGSNWMSNKLASEGYGVISDNLPRPDYVRQQVSVIRAALDLVGDTGVVMYNHKPVHHSRGKLYTQSDIYDHAELNGAIRDQIIWRRPGTNNQGGSFVPPTHEFVCVFAGKRWKWLGEGKRLKARWGSVWDISPAFGNPHPAPFPETLAGRMILAGLDDDGNGVVADPYAGSGTVGLVAHRMHVPYYLNDLNPKYADMFHAEMQKRGQQLSLL